MYRFDGFGTTLLGKKDFNPENKSYISTKWFTALFFPIIPIGSYRVIRTEESKKFLTGGFPEYHMTQVTLDTNQVIKTYITWWLPVLLIILIVYLIG